MGVLGGVWRRMEMNWSDLPSAAHSECNLAKVLRATLSATEGSVNVPGGEDWTGLVSRAPIWPPS